MENKDGLEREISLTEVFWNVLLGWRKILCLAVVFGILLGGFRYMRDVGQYHSEQGTNKSTSTLTDAELSEVNNIKRLKDQLEKDQDYLENSAAMQMDPYCVPILELQYYIKSDYVMNYTRDVIPDYTPALGGMYFRYIASGEMRQNILDESGLTISSEEFEEMIDVSQSSNILYITVKYPEEEKIDDISECIKKFINQKQQDFQKIGSHQLVLMGESQNTIVDESILEKKNSIFTRMASISVQINSLKAALSAQQKNVLDQELNTDTEKENVSVSPQLNKKYLLLGSFVGVFIAGIWIVCKVLFTARLQNPEEIRSLYGVRLLGEINLNNGKKHFLSMIDDKILALKNRRKKKLSVEQQLSVACTNISISCRKDNVNEIYITGSEYENVDADFIKMLKDKLEEQNIEVKYGENMYYDAVSMKQGIEIGNILFVEQIGKSVYDEIFHEIQLVTEQNTNILGISVLI